MISQVSDQTLSLLVEVTREPDLLGDDHFEDLIGIFMHEGAATDHDLIDEHAQGVPVNSLTVTFVQDNLRSQVLRSPTEGVGSLSWSQGLNEAKVRKLEIAARVDEHVLRLKVSVDKVLTVEIVETKNHLCCVEPRQRNVEVSELLDQLEEFAALDELHHNIELSRILLHALHANLVR